MPHDGPGEHHHDIGERIAGHDDTVVWTTVGLDIGSSTSQAVFSRITLAREDAYYVVVDRTVLHQSDVILTPYATPELIDRVRLAAFVEREFAAAHLLRDEIDAGAVIMTGLALSTNNARAIADIVADESGKFVAVSAGDLLEARLAANGAGLRELSAKFQGVVLHADIGGGTTKLSTWQDGKLLRAAAIDVGARLITIDGNRRITRIEAPIARIAATLGLDLRLGEPLLPQAAQTIAASLAVNILQYGGIVPEVPSAADSLLRTGALFASADRPQIAAVVFSGGVSEYIYGRESREFGDLGVPLGRAVRKLVEQCAVQLLESDRGIRATVLGASQHSVQLSGNTIFVSDPAALPLRNLPVLLPDVRLAASALDRSSMDLAFESVLGMHPVRAAAGASLAIAIRWEGSPTFERLEAVAESITLAIDVHLREGLPCVVLVDGDVAGLLGARLNRRLAGKRAVICLDGVHVHEFDHVDIGEFGQHSRALPVVVKSLLFGGTTDHAHVHH
jgi:ethanolamine utilization protein EutA